MPRHTPDRKKVPVEAALHSVDPGRPLLDELRIEAGTPHDGTLAELPAHRVECLVGSAPIRRDAAEQAAPDHPRRADRIVDADACQAEDVAVGLVVE